MLRETKVGLQSGALPSELKRLDGIRKFGVIYIFALYISGGSTTRIRTLLDLVGDLSTD